MAKIKINEIKSIYTNIDENDSSLDLVRTSINLKHLKGFAKAEPRHLAQYDIPDLQNWFGESGWTWETGVYCTLTNDLFAVTPAAAKYDSLVLIAKKGPDTNIYSRSIFWKALDGGPWYEVTKEGNVNHHLISRTFLRTSKVGKTFFQIENGRLKIYMPHDCFWLGFIHRDSNFDYLDYAGIYCDRLVESFNYNDQRIRLYDLFDSNVIPPGTEPQYVTCASTRRLGIKYNLSYNQEQTYGVEEVPASIVIPPAIGYWYHNDQQQGPEFIMWTYQFKDDEGLYISPEDNQVWFGAGGTERPNSYWMIHDAGTTELVIPRHLAKQLIPVGTTWENIADYGDWNVSVVSGSFEVQDAWKIATATFNAQEWHYSTTVALISESGFDDTEEKEFAMIVTAVLDDREEIIIQSRKEEAYLPDLGNYAIVVKDIYVPVNINKRVTRLKFYHKIINVSTDYTLHKEIDLLDLDAEQPYNASFQLSHFTDTGITLAENIAFLYDEKKPEAYKLRVGFRSFVTESGVSVGLSNDDYTRAYYSVLGGGQLQPDIVYSQNLIPISGVSNMNAVSSINDRFGVFTDNTLYIVTSEQIAGALVFEVRETTNLGVKNYQDVANIQGGVIVNTANGIFITSGTDQVSLSEPINDFVKDNFSTSSIFYNKYFNELYYRPDQDHEDLYRFRFEDKTWERLNVSMYYVGPPDDIEPVSTGSGDTGWELTDANDIFVDLNGHRAYLEDTKLWVYNANDLTMPTAWVSFNKTDLGEASIDKLFNEFIIDYTGSWSLYVYNEDGSSMWEIALTDNPTRNLRKYFFPFAKRKTFKKMYMILATNDSDAVLYGMEIDFSVLKQRSYA
jgi:hypothetical protein